MTRIDGSGLRGANWKTLILGENRDSIVDDYAVEVGVV